MAPRQVLQHRPGVSSIFTWRLNREKALRPALVVNERAIALEEARNGTTASASALEAVLMQSSTIRFLAFSISELNAVLLSLRERSFSSTTNVSASPDSTRRAASSTENPPIIPTPIVFASGIVMNRPQSLPRSQRLLASSACRQ